MEKFNIAVNIGAGSKVSFELTYEELLKRHLGKYEIVIKVKPKQLVKQFEIEADIFEPQEISMLDAQASFLSGDMTQFIEKSFSGKKGRVYFNPTIDQQQTCPTCTKSFLDGDFTIKYDVKRDTLCDLQVVNKYFAQFFAPKNLKSMIKNVVFVIDISGSMAGQKIKQTRQALLKILDDIKPDDYFNFILFGGHVRAWKNSLIQATDANLQEARLFVQNFGLAGATNLNGGLLEGINILNKAHEVDPRLRNNAPIVIMLTDGEPTVGETNLTQIRMNVKNAVQGKFPLYNLGFGENVDFTFLEAMSLENNGAARRIYRDNDAAEQLRGFYEEVANPLLTDVEFQYPKASIHALTENRVKQFYDGSEIVVAGQLTDGGKKDFKAEVTGRGAGQDLTGFTLEVTPQNITLLPGMKGPVFSWMDQVTLRQEGVTVTIIPTRKLIVTMDDGATMVVVLHHVWKKHPVHQDFLGLYTVDSHKMSPRTHGLLGQFFHSFDFEVFDVRPGSDPKKTDATMLVKNRRLVVTRGSQKDYRKDPWLGSDVSCWFVHNNGDGLIDGIHTDYIIPSIF
ncbi:inter-alpha-trypsin inhibitor heavy chain H1-like isoform X5 [Petaurus breviceps papuanus]|uniref:inter-alpha-trypsin inhibitor heavy chain H1-like isoform X5 n=1 Tax=Petaurus breviceps papuanus TaxID=3040969 RepID=UPI0036DD1262